MSTLTCDRFLACSSVGCSSSCPIRRIRGATAKPCFNRSFYDVIVPWSRILSDLRGFLGGSEMTGCELSTNSCLSGVPKVGLGILSGVLGSSVGFIYKVVLSSNGRTVSSSVSYLTGIGFLDKNLFPVFEITCYIP